MRYILSIFFLFAFLQSPWVCAEGFPVPALQGPVMDQAGVLSARAQELLHRLFMEANARGKVQLQVLTLKTLNGYTPEQAAILIVDEWKLGSKGKDNGVLILVVPDEKKARIEVGRGLEGDIPDVIAKRILADVARPYFKKNQFSEGILAASLAVLEKADPDFSVESYLQTLPRSSGKKHDSLVFIVLIIAFIIFAKISRFFGGGRGPFMGGRNSGFGGWSGGGGWSGSSGGGWSGGGGGFSGGGASDSW